MKEAVYQAKLVRILKQRFPGAIVLKNDANYLQGIPDLLILYKNAWAALEVKPRKNAPHQANQAYYVHLMNKMRFCAFIFPENEKEVLDALQRSFDSPGEACGFEPEQLSLA
jgi:hypothetical protein